MSDDDRAYAKEMLAWMREELSGDMMVIALAAWAKRYGPQLEARIAESKGAAKVKAIR